MVPALQALLGLLVVIALLVALVMRYWRGRDEFAFVWWWRERKARKAGPTVPLDPVEMFTPGSRHAAGAPCTTSVERLAELDLPTGRIIACDALVGSRGAPAFTRTVPPGRYPVDACIAQIEPGHVRIAAVVIMHSGWGDGIYDSTWGLDADGQPVWLVTDFRVMTAPHRESADRVA